MSQETLADGMGLGSQTQVSLRERDPNTDPKAVEPTPDELLRAELALGLPAGAILRRAGYISEPATPLEQIDAWSFLSVQARDIIKRIVQPEWEKAGRPGLSARKPRPVPARRRGSG